MVIRSLILITLLLANSASFALTAKLDRSSLAQNETLTLQLQSDSGQDLSGLDLAQLRKDFEVLSRSTQSNFNITNGKIVSNTALTLVLKPLRSGDLLIPEFELEGKVSHSISVFVTEPKSVGNTSQDRAVFLEITVDKKDIVVGEQLLYTLRILYATELSNASLPEFKLDGVDIETLLEQRYQKTIDGRTYGVIERRYALFPNKAGELRIPQQELNATIGGSASRFGFSIEHFGQRSQKIRIASDEQSVSVKPMPDGQTITDWLPASRLTLNENWGSDLNTLHVGEPLLRKIQLIAEGLPAARLPEVRMADIAGINIYPEKPELKSETTEQGVIGQRTETLAFIPTQQGTYTLPKVSIKWWDTLNQRYQFAELPEKTLTILPAVNSGAPSTDLPSLNNQPVFDPNSAGSQNIVNGVEPWWQYLALLSIFAWLLTLVYLWSIRNQGSKKQLVQKIEANPSLRHAYRKLKSACLGNEAASAKLALEKWLSIRFTQLGYGSLSDTIKRLNNDKLLEQVNDLNKHLYGQDDSAKWQGAGLIKLVEQLDRVKDDNEVGGLAPLYPKFG